MGRAWIQWKCCWNGAWQLDINGRSRWTSQAPWGSSSCPGSPAQTDPAASQAPQNASQWKLVLSGGRGETASPAGPSDNTPRNRGGPRHKAQVGWRGKHTEVTWNRAAILTVKLFIECTCQGKINQRHVGPWGHSAESDNLDICLRRGGKVCPQMLLKLQFLHLFSHPVALC